MGTSKDSSSHFGNIVSEACFKSGYFVYHLSALIGGNILVENISTSLIN